MACGCCGKKYPNTPSGNATNRPYVRASRFRIGIPAQQPQAATQTTTTPTTTPTIKK